MEDIMNKRMVAIIFLIVVSVGVSFAGMRVIPRVSYSGPEEYRELVVSLCREYFSGPNFPKKTPPSFPITVNIDIGRMDGGKIYCLIHVADVGFFCWDPTEEELAEIEFFNINNGDHKFFEKLAIIGAFYQLVLKS